MFPTININNKSISEFGLTPLAGCLDALMKPAPMKKLVTNTNSTLNGERAITAAAFRKRDKREVTLNFLMTKPDLQTLRAGIEELETYLITQVGDSGIKLYVEELGTTCFLTYLSMQTFTIFDHKGKATISLKFVELDPTKHS